MRREVCRRWTIPKDAMDDVGWSTCGWIKRLGEFANHMTLEEAGANFSAHGSIKPA